MDPGELASATIAIPGRLTTAALLLRLFLPETGELVEIPFDRIMGAVADGEVAAGVIIHESRFTFAEYGLHKVVDLGEWWEESTGHPIPLGGIAARRALGPELVARIESNLRESLKYAYANPDDVRGYVAQHAQEMEMEVMDAHIDLYVNDYTVDYGRDGEAAIADLMGRARAAGIVPSVDFPLFL
jgi:1,4-dihydroxy-6-naphthoate synthase